MFQTLRTHRQRVTKTEILRTALTTFPLTSQNPPLPPDLIELILLLSLQLSSSNHLTQPSLALLNSSPPYTSLQDYTPRISTLLSAHLQSQALALTRLLHPTTNSSFLHRKIPNLGPAITALQSSISEKKSALEAQRLALVPLTVRVLEAYRAGIELIIRILEQYKHGQLARHVKSKSEFLSLEAQQLSFDTKILHQNALGAIYTPEVVQALRNYSEHLRDGRARLEQRQRDAERELERYGVGRQGGEGKEKVMREIARVYGEMQGQIKEVKRDLERLNAA